MWTRGIQITIGGTVACVLLDLLHVQSGTTFYTRPVWLGVAWWTPLLFGAATVATLLGTRQLRQMAGAPPVRWSTARLVTDGLAFVTAYGCSSFLGAAPEVLAGVLTVWWAGRVADDTPPWVVVGCVLTAITGCAVEASLSAAGLFGYHQPDVVGIPWWLGGIYLHAAVLGAGLEGWITTRR
jgi:hypothetical protein